MQVLRKWLRGDEKFHRVYTRFKALFFGDPSKKQIQKMIEYYVDRFVKYSGCFHQSHGTDAAYLTWLYHVIEKGLAMPEMREGFGKEKLIELCDRINAYRKKWGENDPSLRAAVATALEYRRVHENLRFSLEPEVLQKIAAIEEAFPAIAPLGQKEWTREEYCEKSADAASFAGFAVSRHSIRNFDPSAEVKTEEIIEAVKVAMTAPSACNRQPTKVHIVENRETIRRCVALQNGNRGFGHLTNKLIVVTGDLQTALLPQEFFDLYTNVGIFIMNLSYALHEKQIAHCILNWYAPPEVDRSLRDILVLPEEENVVAFIACGRVPAKFKIVSSPRNLAEDVYTVH